MEKLVVKMNDEFYEKDSDMENLIKYIAGEGKNREKEIVLVRRGKGVSNKTGKAVAQMIAVQKAYGKNEKRRLYQLIVIFSKDMHDENIIKESAKRIAEMLFEDYQVFYGIHVSKEHWHVHYAINAVSYRTGMKWHQNKEELEKMKEKISGICDRTINE